ncbi:hypothetical protein E2C01_061390 [Portunus trituberculatus]|uniref:Uncharacterized protein n=1 Tax=Portunus trituberculatus TaxID=210409 RepID=A0A5B7H3Q9_PORTR|nr:hypothetical protein [Portunus trituberculatus]
MSARGTAPRGSAPTRSAEKDVHKLKKVPTQRLRVTLTFPRLTSATPAGRPAGKTRRPPPGTDHG